MSANNTNMSKIKQVMRMLIQRNGGKRPSKREIGKTVGLYKGTVNEYTRTVLTAYYSGEPVATHSREGILP